MEACNLWSILCCNSDIELFITLTRSNKALFGLRNDCEILNVILHRLGIEKRVTNFEELLNTLDSFLFSFFISSYYRRLRWKHVMGATSNKPLEAIGKSILIKDFDTCMKILEEEYSSFHHLPSYTEAYLIAYTLTIDEELTWIKDYDLVEELYSDAHFQFLVETRPPGWQYAASKIITGDDIRDFTDIVVDICQLFMSNKDYLTLQKFVAKFDLSNIIIAKAICASTNREAYYNPQILGLKEESIPSKDTIRNFIVEMSNDVMFLQEMFDKGVITEADIYPHYLSRTGVDVKVILWKLQFESFRNYFIHLLISRDCLCFFNDTSIEEYIGFIDKLSEMSGLSQAEIFMRMRHNFGVYGSRELLKIYKNDVTKEMLRTISGSNFYEDREFNKIIREIEERLSR